MSTYNADFEIAGKKKDRLTVLQLTDTQVIDADQCRYPDRLSGAERALWLPACKEARLYRYIRAAVQKADPDLIVITGDFIYGEFDDSGKSFRELTDFMDSFQIPWTVVYGNHERESLKGAQWQTRVLESSKYCLYKHENFVRGARLEGDGSFSVSLATDGLGMALFLLDQTCRDAAAPLDVGVVQREWLASGLDAVGGLPAFVFMHVPMRAYHDSAVGQFGTEYADKAVLQSAGGSGYYGQQLTADCFWDEDGSFFELLRQKGVKATFCGHFHKNSAITRYQDVWLCYGLKTGEYDSHLQGRMGGTVLSLTGNGFEIDHIYISF